jgi:hypothetical protein
LVNVDDSGCASDNSLNNLGGDSTTIVGATVGVALAAVVISILVGYYRIIKKRKAQQLSTSQTPDSDPDPSQVYT